MNKAARMSYRKLALKNAKKPWGAGWMRLSEDQKETEILAAAARIVLLQELPEYGRAQSMLLACTEAEPGESDQ